MLRAYMCNLEQKVLPATIEIYVNWAPIQDGVSSVLRKAFLQEASDVVAYKDLTFISTLIEEAKINVVTRRIRSSDEKGPTSGVSQRVDSH